VMLFPIYSSANSEALLRARPEMLRAGLGRRRGVEEAELAPLLSPAPGRTYRFVEDATDNSLYVICDSLRDGDQYFSIRLGAPTRTPLIFTAAHPNGHRDAPAPPEPIAVDVF